MRSRIILRTLIVILINQLYFGSEVFAQSIQTHYNLNDARNAFRNYDIELGAEILNQLWNDPNISVEDKINAGKYLSDINSKFLNKKEEALKVIDATIKLNPEDFNSYLRYSQITDQFEASEKALQYGLIAAQKAKSLSSKISAYNSLCKVALSTNITKILNSPKANQLTEFSINQKVLEKAIVESSRVVANDPTKRELLKVKFALEVLAGKGNDALRTWKDYFSLNESSSAYMKHTYKMLGNSLENYTGQNLELSEKKSLIKSLSLARDYDLAMVFMNTVSEQEIKNDMKLREIVAYYEFLELLKKETTIFYQNTALGKANPNAFRNALIVGAKVLWDKLKMENEPKPFILDDFEKEVDQRFGGAIRIGNANGWFSITWGHIIDEQIIEINQYGRTAELTYKNLDYMTSNGFIGWYFDRLGVFGGWQSDAAIYRVRPNYLLKGLEAWNMVSDKKNLNTIFPEPNEEISISNALLQQLKIRAYTELLNDLKEQGFDGANLKNQFIKSFDHYTYKNEIEFHEGRHFIDKKEASVNNNRYTHPELEFKAKLSEIAFATYPFMALASILNAGIDGSAHGIANKRLLEELDGWMKQNAQAIQKFDAQIPAYIQLNKLTNSQLITAIKTFDNLDDKL